MAADSISEVLRLRKELHHTKQQVMEHQEELEEKTNMYIKAIAVSQAPVSHSIGARPIQREAQQRQRVHH